MKTILLTTLSLLFITSCAQETVNGNGKMKTEIRKVSSNFNSVESAGAFDVIIKDAVQDGNIKLEGESNVLEKIEVKLEGSTLVLKQKPGFNFRNTKNVTIILNGQNLQSIGLSGSGNITTEGIQKVNSFNAGLSGSGNVNVKVSAKNIKAGISGSGNINLKGNSDNAEYGVSGSGDIHAFDLKSSEVEVGISGSGNVKLTANESLKASIAGSGDVYYKGNPQNLNVKSGGSGDVIDAN